jgi:hypothetical protein
MSKQGDERPPAEAKKVMDDTLRRMLATKPDPHVTPKKKPAKRHKARSAP